jgi:predicted amidohydrolase
MQSPQIRLATIQVVSTNGRVAENLVRAGHRAKQAAQQDADAVLLPELFSIGHEINARVPAEFRFFAFFEVVGKRWHAKQNRKT